MDTTMNTPRSEQGQVIVPSYGWVSGQYYMRAHDRSDGTVEWFRAENRDEIPDEYNAGGYDDPPPVSTWISCEKPADDEDE